MSSNGTPKYRKAVEHRRERKAPAEEVEELAPPKPVLIEPVTKDDPATVSQPSLQKEPPRAPGP